MKCLSCGKESPRGSTFCLNCGSRIDDPAVTHTGRFSLTRTAMKQWRDRFSAFYGWEVGKPFGDKSRRLLATLNLPFVPEEEALIFDPGINSTQHKVAEIAYKNYVLRDGFFFATESRLIFGNEDLVVEGQEGIALQIPYEDIKAIYANGDAYSVALRDGTEARIRTKVPRPSLLGAVAIMGGSPMDKATISRMEREKAESAQDFVATFTGFFTEIADENRQRRGTDAIGAVVNLETQVATSTAGDNPVHSTPVVIQNPWYRSTGCLLVAFLFSTPIWSVLILTDKKQATWVKALAGVFLAVYMILVLSN